MPPMLADSRLPIRSPYIIIMSICRRYWCVGPSGRDEYLPGRFPMEEFALLPVDGRPFAPPTLAELAACRSTWVARHPCLRPGGRLQRGRRLAWREGSGYPSCGDQRATLHAGGLGEGNPPVPATPSTRSVSRTRSGPTAGAAASPKGEYAKRAAPEASLRGVAGSTAPFISSYIPYVCQISPLHSTTY